jgi:hypothetical protein
VRREGERREGGQVTAGGRAQHARPAWANDPVASRASRRMPRPSMPIGMDPAAENSTGARAPGSASTSR